MMRHPLSWMLLGVLAIALVFWDRSPRELLMPKPAAEVRFPNAYMLNVQIRDYTPQGDPEYYLQAERVEHHQRNTRRPGPGDYTLLTAPLMTFFGATPGTEPWRLNAEQGRSELEGSVITLERSVRAWQASRAQGLFELTTERLIVEPGKQFAHTDKAVTMRSPQGVTRAVGLHALLDQDRIELLSEVQGHYEP